MIKLIDFSIQQIKEEFNLEVELTLKSELVDFITDRLFVMFEDKFDSEVLEALRKTSPLADLKQFKKKCEDLQRQKDTENFREFVEQAKRISRITEGVDKKLLDREILASNLKTNEEKNLLEAINNLKKIESVQNLYNLTPLINAFFEAVLVNDENVEDKNNRLSMLLQLRRIFETVADFTKFKKV